MAMMQAVEHWAYWRPQLMVVKHSVNVPTQIANNPSPITPAKLSSSLTNHPLFSCKPTKYMNGFDKFQPTLKPVN